MLVGSLSVEELVQVSFPTRGLGRHGCETEVSAEVTVPLDLLGVHGGVVEGGRVNEDLTGSFEVKQSLEYL